MMGWSDRKARAAAAGRLHIRIVDLEGLPDQVVDEVDPRAAQEIQRHRIDEHHRAFLLDHQVFRLALLGDIESVLETGAAAAIDRDAERRARRLLGKNGGDAAGGAVGHLDRGKGRGFAHEALWPALIRSAGA